MIGILLLLFAPAAWGIIAYDCGNEKMNLTTISLLDVGDCETPTIPQNFSSVKMQLLQIDDYNEVEVRQCKIEIHRTVYYCGMHSHIAAVKNGYAEYVNEVSPQACEDMIRTGSFKYSNDIMIESLKVNSTRSSPVTFAGVIRYGGKCQGTQYSDLYGTWDDAVVQGTVKISLQTQLARANRDENVIILRSGVRCQFSDGSCMDTEGGNSHWEVIPRDSCKFDKYSILYEGYANRSEEYYEGTLRGSIFSHNDRSNFRANC